MQMGAARSLRIAVIFQSWGGQTHRLAEAVARGAAGVPGAVPLLRRVPELRSEAALLEDARIGPVFAGIRRVPLAGPDDLVAADAIVVGCPTRMGTFSAEMKHFVDGLSGLWRAGAFENKVGAAFTTASTPHGGQEMTLMSLNVAMMHLGMVIASPGYTAAIFEEAGSPYGATATTKRQGVRVGPGADDIRAAEEMGARVARVAGWLAAGRDIAQGEPGRRPA